jgi:hypothetical protein
MRHKLLFFGVVLFSLACFVSPSFCQDTPRASPQPSGSQEGWAGEFSGWGVKVPIGNYYFIKSAIMVFGTRWGSMPTTPQEWEDRVWEQLLLSYEAFRRDLKVEQKELDDEITKTLGSEKVAFDWKTDKEAYAKWVKERIGEPVELFENELRHLLQLEHLRQQVMENIKPTVTEGEAYQKFLNEYNTLELELLQFDELKDALTFYDKVKDSSSWEEEVKKFPKESIKRPGFVSLEFLIDMWKIPKDDLYKMLKLQVDSTYPPVPIYKGYGVFRILKKREAQDSDFPRLRDSYFKQVEMMKKYEGLQSWLKQLKEEAKIKPYPLPSPVPEPQVQEKAPAAAKE